MTDDLLDTPQAPGEPPSVTAPDRFSEARAYLRKADPVIGALIDTHPDFDPRAWLDRLPKMDAFGALIFQIIGQQLSVQATRTLLARVQDRFGGHLPTPEQVLTADPEVLHEAGLSRRKAQTIIALATEFAEHRITDDALREMSDAEIEAELTAIPGIGSWTVHGFLIVALDRQDVVLPGDLALRKAIQRNYQLDHLPSQDEVLQIAQAWRPYRTLASTYLFASAYE
jgi:DNA-3-methyladenine glycosylase II